MSARNTILPSVAAVLIVFAIALPAMAQYGQPNYQGQQGAVPSTGGAMQYQPSGGSYGLPPKPQPPYPQTQAGNYPQNQNPQYQPASNPTNPQMQGVPTPNGLSPGMPYQGQGTAGGVNPGQYGTQGGTYQQPQLVPRNTGTPMNGGMQPGSSQPVAPQAPFTLSPQQRTELIQTLHNWESLSQKVKQFECTISQFKNHMLADGRTEQTIRQGSLKYKSPDKGIFELNGQWVPGANGGSEFKQGMNAEKWLCTGNAIYEYDFRETVKEVIEYPLPPNMQGEAAITNGPLPFVFGAKADVLDARYFMRVIPQNDSNLVWIEAYPKYQEDAKEFRRAEIILQTATMMPVGLKLYHLDGKDSTSYRFDIDKNKINDNPNPLFSIFTTDPFKVTVPSGWKLVRREMQTNTQVGAQPNVPQPR